MSLFETDKQAPIFCEPAFPLIVTFSDLVFSGDTRSPLQSFTILLLPVDLVEDLGDLGPSEGLFGVKVAFLISY